MSESIDVAVWSAIVGAVEDADTMVGRAFAEDDAVVDLDALSRKLSLRLDTLREALQRTLPESKARQVLAPITFLLDERVLGRLAGRALDRELEWPLLQTRVVDLEYGGDLFFMQAERLGHGPDPWPLLVQVFEYCLREGFQGRYADRPGQLTELQDSLWARLDAPLPPGHGGTVALDRLARPPLSRRVIAGLVVAGCLLTQGLFFAAFRLL